MRARHILHTCSCGKKFTVEGWETLPLVGYQNDEELEEPTLELRNCPCGSTRAVEPKSPKESERTRPARGTRSLTIERR